MNKTTLAFLFGLLILPGETRVEAIHAVSTSMPTRTTSPTMTSQVGEIVRGPRGKSQIALTFDAGAEAECFYDLIATLEQTNVHSTFFITGNWAQRNRDCATGITQHKHEVGNHTWNHLNLVRQNDQVVREEISRAEVILTALTGRNPKPLWRAPYGERDRRVLRIANSLGYRSIYWTLDSLDSVEPVKAPDFLINRVTNRSDADLDGAIILMHVGVKSTAEALPAIISNLQARGFQLVTVSKLLETARLAR